MEMFRRTYAEINLDHLAHNFHYLHQALGRDRFYCPMIKANAYGHGDVAVAKLLEAEGATHLGVCLIEEGLLLRAQGISTEILVFRGFDMAGAEKIVQFNLVPVVSAWEQLDYLETQAEETVKVHLKFDTGMNRLGFNSSEAERLRDYFIKSKKLKLRAVLTHFAHGEDAYTLDGKSTLQLQKLQTIAEFFKDFNIYYHALNSGGILSSIHCLENKIQHPVLLNQKWGLRPGLALYGHHAMSVGNYHLKPVMTLKSVVNNVREVPTGEAVSYGSTWVAKRPSQIAVVPIGYADGYHRLLSNRGECLLMGERVPVVGRVCMDYLMLDITDLAKKYPVDQLRKQDVVLFGNDDHGKYLSPTEVAHHAQTISWEVLTSVGERVPRVFKGRPFASYKEKSS